MTKPNGNMNTYTLVELARVLTHANEKGRHNALFFFNQKLRDPWGSSDTEKSEAAKVMAGFVGASEELRDALLCLIGKGAKLSPETESHFLSQLSERDTIFRFTGAWRDRREVLGTTHSTNPARFIIQQNPLRALNTLEDFLCYEKSQQWLRPSKITWCQWMNERGEDGLTPAALLIDWAGQDSHGVTEWSVTSKLASLVRETMEQYRPWDDLGRLCRFPALQDKLFSLPIAGTQENAAIIRACVEQQRLLDDTPTPQVRAVRVRL